MLDKLTLAIAENPTALITLFLCWAAFNTVSTLVLAGDIGKIRGTLKRVLPSRYWKELE